MANVPAISVVTPMYNAEKYLGETLDCLLMQTFQNFEVILVNDCSTDNSRAVAENYLEKFGGRLKLYDNTTSLKASGTRNRGVLLSRGEYIFFLDADDLIMLDGLERMYTLAKKYDADVVSFGGFYKINGDSTEITSVSNRNEKIFEGRKEKIFVDEDLSWRLEKNLAFRFYGVPWLRLFRRDFLIGNGIFFPENVSSCEDVVWKHGFLLLAKKIVHARDILNFYRMSDDSLTRTKRNAVEYIHYRMNTIFYGIKWIDEILSKSDFFVQNPQYRYKILGDFTEDMFNRLLVTARKRKWTPATVYKLVRQEFAGDFGENGVLVSVLCALLNEYQKDVKDDEARIEEIEKKLNQRKKS